MNIQEITKEAWDILVALSQTAPYEFPDRIPLLQDRAGKLIEEMIKQEDDYDGGA